VAARSVKILAKLVTEQNFRAYGFTTRREVLKATPGAPFAVYYVRLDDLREYKEGVDPNRLLRDSGRLMYPLTTGPEVRSAVTLRKRGESWEPANFGDAALIRLMTAVRSRSAGRTGAPSVSYFLLRLPISPSYLVGRRDGAKLILTSITANRRANLHPYEDILAEKVFAALAPIARRTHGIQ
jgi:hypothetical protein